MTQIKNISIRKILAERGVNPSYERGGYGMYLSPLRSERTPSFKVDYNCNLWYDFGLGEGGSVVDLVMKMDNLSFHEAAKKLESEDFSSLWVKPATPPIKTESPIKITEVRELKNSILLNYIKGRGIDTEIASRYCKEVYYTINGKSYFGVAFRGDKGGYEISTNNFKISTSPKSPTTINYGYDVCLVFEGFMNMLSYLTLEKCAVPLIDIVVLNSVSNLSKAKDFLCTHRSLHCFLDNDAAGRKALDQMNNWGVEIVDHSNLYSDFNDLNDYLKSKNQVEKPVQKGRKMKF